MSNLKERINSLRETISGGRESDSTYMSKMRHWLCVHTTRYEPKRNEDGNLYIETTAMATDNELPRASVHVTLNQVVSSHMGGNWDDAPIVVLAPYNDVVSKNGNPQEISTADTWFFPNPDTGLVLPDNTYIVKPSADNSKLYEIGENCATYKTDNYTDDEIEEILSLSEYDKYKYDEYMSGVVPDYNVRYVLGNDEKLIKMYEESEDKRAFMRGIFEEDRFVILNRLLRNAVVKMAMEKMDFRYVISHENETTGVVADVAREAGIRGNSGNKGHSFSFEHELEEAGCALVALSKKMKDKEVWDIFNCLKKDGSDMSKEIISSIINDTPIPNAYFVYENVLSNHIKESKDKLDYFQNEDWQKKEREKINKLENGGIKAYNPHLDTMLHRQADRMTKEFNDFLNGLKQNPEKYEELKQLLIEDKKNNTFNQDNLFMGNPFDKCDIFDR
ncbi:MAG: hypothetical protein IJE43_23150 [Alphaproteobacteria bacterium]|nr:hypothetical protein [Alphaproteobacteria bacterium]